MDSRDFRMSAWRALDGAWGTFALSYLIVTLILSSTSIPYIGFVVELIVGGPIFLSLAEMSLKVVRGEQIEVGDCFDGFKNFKNAVLLHIINNVFIMLWTLLFVVPGIIKAISYSMSTFILAEHPDMDANDARHQSMAMMEGNKWRYFLLNLSFLGWMILVVLTFGILLLWVAPYMSVAKAEFYENLKVEQGITREESPLDEMDAVAIDMDDVFGKY